MEKEQVLEQLEAESSVATYDPQKKYTWDQNSRFVMSGPEFGLLLNTLRVMIASEEVQKALMLQRSASVIEHMLEKAVESGVAKEITENPLRKS